MPRSADEEEELLDGSINLTARLMLMMDIGVLQLGFSGRRKLIWSEGSLKDFLHDYFCQPRILSHDNVKLEKILTARNLVQIAGFDIVWTDNGRPLASGERRRQKNCHLPPCVIPTVAAEVSSPYPDVFMQRVDSISHIFPDGLIDETLETLALLFPSSDEDTDRWLEKLSGSLPHSVHIDRNIVRCGQLRAEKRQLENFNFWHDRLVILKQAFDQSRPATISQWWLDRRNGVQWYTFWVAVLVLFLTIFFGLIQSIEGALQVYKAYHPTIL